jgi:lipoprotein-anchoring transpeptidase ErfK/SrfK
MRRPDSCRPKARAHTQIAAVGAAIVLAAAETFAQESKTSAVRVNASTAEPARRIIVSILDRKLALVENGRVVRIYAVAVGASVTPSPSGEFRIIQRVVQPAYYRPGIVIPPGKENPLGTRWLGLSQPGYGIHGTNEPGSIGRRASHGCIRMRNRDVEGLFELVRVGDVVELRAARDAELAQVFPAPNPHRLFAGPPGGSKTVLAAQAETQVPAKEASEGRNN